MKVRNHELYKPVKDQARIYEMHQIEKRYKMKNINKNTNIIGGNAINNDMYRMLDGYKPSSGSSSR